MPWKETGPMLERTKFIDDYLSGFFTITELAHRYGVSRRILHKWLARHDREGIEGLADRSRAPARIPHRTDGKIVDEIVAFRRRFPHMGPKKIAVRLAELHPDVEWPAPSTIGDILQGETVGLEEIDDGVWSLYYGGVLLARFDEREGRFYG